jgi:uncharacterized protein YtpQ (UPF0354 family)
VWCGQRSEKLKIKQNINRMKRTKKKRKITLNKFIIMALIGTLLNFFGCSGNKNKIMNEKEFTTYYLKVLKKQLPDIDFVVVGDLEISSKQKPDNRHFLDNAYRIYKLNPKAIEETILPYVNNLISLYEEEEEKTIQKNRIVPLIKPRDYLDILQNSEKETSILHQQYNEDLIIVYMHDMEYSLSSISMEDFEKLGIDKDTLLDFSIKNLKEILPDIQRGGENGSYYIIAGGTFEASLILLETLWTKETFDVDGEFVIAIPCRDFLVITGSNNTAGIENLKSFAEKMYREGDHNISPFLYKWNGKNFERFTN